MLVLRFFLPRKVISRNSLERAWERSETTTLQNLRISRVISQSTPKKRRRRRAEKRWSKRVLLESPFLLCPLKVWC